jgi:catechol 2,3-dioxygenase-like lactoylglutathione lyase family enzyme
LTVTLDAGLVGRDQEGLCAFYTRTMGFTLVERLPFEVGTVCKFRRDAARLKIFFSVEAIDPAAPPEPWFRPGGWRYAALNLDSFEEVDELAAAVDASNGRVLIAPTSHRPGARMAMVSDPEANVWELLAEARSERG